MNRIEKCPTCQGIFFFPLFIDNKLSSISGPISCLPDRQADRQIDTWTAAWNRWMDGWRVALMRMTYTPSIHRLRLPSSGFDGQDVQSPKWPVSLQGGRHRTDLQPMCQGLPADPVPRGTLHQ